MNHYIRAAEVRVVRFDDIKNLIETLPLEQKERLVAKVFASLPEESKKKIPELGGVNVSTDGSSLCNQIQNAPNVDIASIIEAAALRHKRDRESKL